MNYRNENATPCARYSGCTGGCTRRTHNNAYHKGGSCNTNTVNTTFPKEEARCNTGCGTQMSTNKGGFRRCTQQRCCVNTAVCGSDNGHICGEAPIAMVYSPMQKWRELYDPHTALSNGTIFKELDLPFYPTPCRRKENNQCQCR